MQFMESGLFRKRDLCVLALVAVTLYVSTFDSPNLRYSVEPAWFIDQRTGGKTHKKYDSLDSLAFESNEDNRTFDFHFLPPIITDLDGNGANEIICVTKDRTLKVFSTNTA